MLQRTHNLSDKALECTRKIFGADSHFVQNTTKAIWNHWDSSVSGVPELTSQVFTCLLDIHKKEMDSYSMSCDELFDHLLETLLQMPWQIKGKHRMLICLVKYVGIKKVLLIDPNLPKELFKCQAVNFMASTSAELYKELIKLQRNTGHVSEWSETWLDVIIETLISRNSVLRHNCSQFCVKYTLKVFPEAFDILIQTIIQRRLETGSNDYLKLHSSYLYAWVIVMKLARQQQIIALNGEEPLREALYHTDDDIRADAFLLLTVTKKKSENLSCIERNLIKEFLAINLNIDSPQFRTALLFGIKAICIRVRDSSLSLWKAFGKTCQADKTLQGKIDDNLDFVDWILNLCTSNLYPGASFQRKSTVIEVMTALYDAFISNEATDSVILLISYAQSKGCLLFHSQTCIKALLACTQDDSSSIQIATCKLLRSTFPWPIQWTSIDPELFATLLLRQCLTLCSSPRQQDGSCGAQLFNMLVSMYVIQCKWHFKTENDLATVSMEKSGFPLIESVEFLINEIEVSVLRAEENIQLAASTSPGYGLIQCLLQTLRLVNAEMCESGSVEWMKTVEKMLSLCRTVINDVLSVLGGCAEDKATSPSFAKMGLSILTAANQFDEDIEDSTILSEHYKRVLTWCWLNLKECSLLLGQIVESFGVDGVILSEKSIIQDIADLFYKILTKCRHRGAIEKCNKGFLQFCSCLITSKCRSIQEIPKQILQKVLSMLTTVCKTSSITRRSAGLPLLVTSIVASELITKRTVLLNEAVQTLLDVGSTPLPNDEDQRIDLPQVHAINIMKAILKESSLSSAIQPFLSDLMIFSITGFSSASWALRNAATQLFGTVLSKVLGQKRMKDETSIFNSSLTLNQFFAQYPDLRQFMFGLLRSCHSTGRIQPTIFPILAILARLSPGADIDLTEFKEFHEALFGLLKNPIYAVRELTAASTPVFIAKKDIHKYMLDIVCDKLPNSAEVCNQNELHGLLMLLEKLLSLERLSVSWQEILDKLLLKSWINTSQNPCSLTRALFLRIMNKVCKLSGVRLQDTMMHSSMKEISLDGRESLATHTQIGYGKFQQVVASSIMQSNANDVEKLSEDLEILLLKNKQVEVKKSVLNWLRSTDTSKYYAIKAQLLEFFDCEKSMNLLQMCIDVLVSIHYERRVEQTCKPKSFRHMLSKLDSICKSEKSNSLTAGSLCIIAIILSDSEDAWQNVEYRKFILAWSENLVKVSHPKENVAVRLYCAHALNIAGGKSFTDENSESLYIQKNLFDAAVTLLQDEDPEIRRMISQFAVSLSPAIDDGIQYTSVQFNHGLFLVANYVVQQSKTISVWLPFICEKLYLKGSLINILQKTATCEKSLILFEQEEINMFAEKVNLLTTLHKCMMTIPAGYFKNSEDNINWCYIQQLATDICDDFIDAIPEISRLFEEKNLFNIIWTAKVHGVIEGILLLADFLQCQIDDFSDTSTKLKGFSAVLRGILLDGLPKKM
ncbi:tRNA (32-2'-O)-methyltransferase regulator THADA-like [Tubulanus polymorphus]|uniref:tRNA (32-2'-O)-methyltransferase regulator THADA-like n=1 Tax=Tubulanus polymorphus TaxID=672921 RepID=UPI003DA4535B